jgi:hypothetical protein
VLLNHLIRPHQHVCRNRQAELLRGFQIAHKLKLRRLLNRQVGRLCPPQNLVTNLLSVVDAFAGPKLGHAAMLSWADPLRAVKRYIYRRQHPSEPKALRGRKEH